MKFIKGNSSFYALCIGYKEKYIVEAVNTKLLHLQIDDHINLKNNIEQIITTLSGACYAVRLVVHISNIDTLKSVYYAYFPSVIK